MQRHPEFKYKIKYMNRKERWLFIEDVGDSGWGKKALDTWSDENSSGLVEFLLRIKEKYNWTIKEVGSNQYSFEEDNMSIIFQWDDLFGFVIVTAEKEKMDEAMSFIQEFLV